MKILSENEILKLIKSGEIDWNIASKDYALSEPFIKEFQDKVNWGYISTYQKLSEDFIREFQDKVIWDSISEYQKLSEDFIREFQDKVNWYRISIYQKLSEDFIKKFQDKVIWYCIKKYQKLSEPFIREFNLKVNKTTNWNYVSNDIKLKAIENSKLYEIIDNEYIIAYKGIRSDNYSKFNFQYQYLIGNTYESHCDANINNENSFGLSAWTLEEAKEYCNEKIIKIKIHIDDVKALVHNSHKIRCSKLEVIEEVEALKN